MTDPDWHDVVKRTLDEDAEMSRHRAKGPPALAAFGIVLGTGLGVIIWGVFAVAVLCWRYC